MTIKLDTTYPGQSVPATTARPLGAAQNVTVSGDGTGTPLEETWVNDLYGWWGAFLDSAGVVASGSPDEVGTSDMLDAFNIRIGTTANLRTWPNSMQHAFYDGESFDVGTPATETSTTGLAFKDDGTKMYTTGFDNQSVYEWALSTPFDVTTATFTTSVSVAAQTGTGLQAVFFKIDGTKMYVLSIDAADTIYQYTLPTPWSVVGASYDTVSFAGLATSATAYFNISPDGLLMTAGDANTAYDFALGVAWDISTAVYQGGGFFTGVVDAATRGFSWGVDGTRFYFVGATNMLVYAYSVPTPYDVNSAVQLPESFDVSNQIPANPQNMFFSTNGGRMFIIDSSAPDTVFQYHTSTVTIDW